jgi:hypothetical protein
MIKAHPGTLSFCLGISEANHGVVMAYFGVIEANFDI